MMDCEAPLSGVVVEVCVEPKSQIETGQLLVILESMKVHVRVESEATGIVDEIYCKPGDSIQRGQPLLKINAKRSDTTIADTIESDQQGEEHDSYAEWQARTKLTKDAARAAAVAKRHAKGYASARENLAQLCDLDSFLEYGELAVAAQRARVDYETLKTTTAADGVITGIGQVNGVETAIVINDYSVLAGTQGYFHHMKIDRILEVAEQRKIPVIMFTEGGGGRPGDTDVTTVNSGLQCTSFGTWAGLSGKVPRISVANGYNFAGNAALFGAADITIATEKSWVGMAGPAMIEGGGLGSFAPTDIGPVEVQQANGVVDLVAVDEKQACELASRLVSLLSIPRFSNFENQNQETLNLVMPNNRKVTYDVNDVVTTIADSESVIELQANFAGSIRTYLARVGGRSIGVMANDCRVLGGAIDADAGLKASRFMTLCDDFSLPIVSLCDTPGFMVGPEHESQGAVRKLAELFKAGAKITVPFYAVVLRKCYGLGAQAMLGGSTQRPLYTMSWPSGEFGAMGLEGAVKLGFKKDLEAAPSAEARKELFDELLAIQYERGQAIEVASVLELDAVINPRETRRYLSQLLDS